MKKTLGLASVLLNLVLVTSIVVLATGFGMNKTPSPESTLLASVTPAESRPKSMVEVEGVEHERPHDVPSKPFHWGLVESEDLRQYFHNLRAINCPAEAIEDILYAEIDHRFLRERQKVLAPAVSNFWQLLATQFEDTEDLIDHDQIESLRKERNRNRKQVRQLLKDSTDATLTESLLAEADEAQSPPDEVEPVETEFEAKKRDLKEQYTSIYGSDLDEALRKQFDRELDALKQQIRRNQISEMNDDQFEQFVSNDNSLSSWVATSGGFDATEKEMRQLAQLKILHGADQQTRDEAIRDVLGSNRFEDYERSQNPNFQDTLKVINRHELPHAVAVDAFETRQLVRQTVNEVKSNGELSPEQRQLILSEVRNETIRRYRGMLKGDAYDTYLKYIVNWMDDIGK